MKAVFKKYLWLFKFIGAALILGLGVFIAIKNEVLYLIVGLAFIILGGLRVIPLLKTTEDKMLRWIYFGEILLEIGAGIALLVLYFQEKTNQGNLIGYLIGGVLYLRALVFFFATTLRKEISDVTQFISHVIFFTVGTAIIVSKGFNPKTLAWVIFAIALLTAIVFGLSGYSNYNRYRHEFKAVAKTKEITAKKEADVELPKSEDKKDKIIEEPQEEQERIIQ